MSDLPDACRVAGIAHGGPCLLRGVFTGFAQRAAHVQVALQHRQRVGGEALQVLVRGPLGRFFKQFNGVLVRRYGDLVAISLVKAVAA
ncbi:hypothetical protein D3C71_1755350 [compost metagenome]